MAPKRTPPKIPKPTLDLSADATLEQFVREAYHQVQSRRDQNKAEILEELQQKSRNAVCERRVTSETRCYSRLPSNASPMPPLVAMLYCQPVVDTAVATSDAASSNESSVPSESSAPPAEPEEMPPKPVAVRIRHGNSQSWQAPLPYEIPLEGAHEPLPRSNATVFLKTHYCTEDEKNLAYVPYFGEDDHDMEVLELFDTEERERQMAFGPEYKERDSNDAIDETLSHIQQKLLENNVESEWAPPKAGKSPPRSKLQNRIHEALADILSEEVGRINDRYREVVEKELASGEDPAPSRSHTENPDSYEMLMDSYRPLFCRRCFTYDCNIHGNLDKPNLELQTELALQREREGYWETKSENDDSVSSDDNEKKQPALSDELLRRKRVLEETMATADQRYAHITELSPTQKVMVERSFITFQGDIVKIAFFNCVPSSLVADYVKEKGLTLGEFKHVIPEVRAVSKKSKKKNSDAHSMKNYNLAWLRNVEGAEIHPSFHPCDHVGPCSEENCTCVSLSRFCTKHCVWGDKSRNFFRGCSCKGGKCTTKSCPCFAAKRECDPDLCRTCGACTDPPSQPATKQRCRNDNIGMRRHCHLLLAKSTIEDAGWGIFTKHALKKGDFVHEYVGELISQEEAERRGRIYDKVNRSYLFNLCSDSVVDASRKGNKTRYANHSVKPNCETMIYSVNGDNRIGLFAIHDIEPQSELFFDYRYDASMDNSLIIKTGMTVDWQKDSKMANTIKKKHA